MKLHPCLLAILIAVLAFPAYAVEPQEMLADPALEARAREIGKELRCLVCQNQSIDDSNAELAADLRVLVRSRLKAGDSNEAVIQYVVDRYGDYVLLKPPFKSSTAVLWIGPFVLLLITVAGVFIFYRRKQSMAPVMLSENERRHADELLGDDRPSP